MSNEQAWPALPVKEWQATRDTLHMWTQVIGKVRLALSPLINHWWETPLYITARGLTTSPIPYDMGIFEIEFDFIEHKLNILTSNGLTASILLYPRSVADFYADVMGTLSDLGIQVKIWHMPAEIPNPIPLDTDRIHASYDPDYANRFWRVLVSTDTVMKEFRGRFIGKNSPVHFFWGSFDLAVTRFSGRRAPERPGADKITREAYSHEVSSVGFWPGSEGVSDAVFYSYFAPEPAGFSKSPVQPAAALYSTQLNEFLLPYDAVRLSASPREALLDFFQSTYEAGADLGGWDRANLERPSLSRPA
jgi:uncharacterized protein DUF5996